MDDFEDVDEEDKSKTTYPCLFCGENFDLLELWCHIDEDHSVEAKTGICPLCVTWVGTNLGEHISAQHRNILKSQHKSGHQKLEPYRTLSRKDLKDGDEYWQSFPAGTSPKISVSTTASDPWLSFLTNVAAGDEREKLQPDSSSEVSLDEEHPKESVLVRDVQPSLSDRDQIGKAQRSKFVQQLFISTILDP